MSTALLDRLPLPSIRLTNFGIAASCTIAMLTAIFYFQKTLQLQPCPLCVTQRVFMITIGLIGFIAFVHNPKGSAGQRLYAGFGFVAAAIGAGVAARHTWLQSLPEELAPACGPGLSYMFDTMPLLDALRVLFQGDGDCAEVVWSFLGLSIPGWTLVAFAGFAIVNIWQFFRSR